MIAQNRTVRLVGEALMVTTDHTDYRWGRTMHIGAMNAIRKCVALRHLILVHMVCVRCSSSEAPCCGSFLTSCARTGGGGWGGHTGYNLCHCGDHTGHTKGQCRRWHTFQRVEVLPSPLAHHRTLQIGRHTRRGGGGRGAACSASGHTK